MLGLWYGMAMRKREDLVFPNAAAIDVGALRALTGNWREEHLFVLKQALAMYDDIAKHLRECEAKLQALLAERSVASVELGKVPRAGSKARAEFDVRQQLANWAGADLTRINGLGLDSVMKILSEIGTDLGRFANARHFCSWLGLCPATKISGGKVWSARTTRSANRVSRASALGLCINPLEAAA